MTESQFPNPWLDDGAVDESERAAAQLLQNAFGKTSPEPSDAVGAKMRVRIAERLDTDSAPMTLVGSPRFLNRVLAVGALATAAAALFISIMPLSSPRSGQRITSGRVVALGSDGVRRPLAVGQVPESGTELTCIDALCQLGVGTGVQVAMQKDAAFSISSPERTEVRRGYVSFAVDHLAPGESFAVQGGDTLVEVVGTAFGVEVVPSSNGQTEQHVTVSEGKVRVTHGSSVTYVGVGEQWSSASLGRSAAAAAPPQRVEEPAATGLVKVEPPKSPNGTKPVEVKAKTPSELMERAAKLVSAGSLNDARAVYAKMADRGGSTAELGLYMLAQLELRHAKNPQAAQAALVRMAKEFPKGSMALERALTQIETHFELGECANAHAGMDFFRVNHPRATAMLAELETAMEVYGCPR